MNIKKDFLKVLTFSVKSCFLFNNIYYKQVYGVAMGLPLGPTLAILFLVHFKSKWLSKYPVQFWGKYCCYVDNIFSILKRKTIVKSF